jgi:hypothetical protein
MKNNNTKKIVSRGLQTFEEKQRKSSARARTHKEEQNSLVVAQRLWRIRVWVALVKILKLRCLKKTKVLPILDIIVFVPTFIHYYVNGIHNIICAYDEWTYSIQIACIQMRIST